MIHVYYTGGRLIHWFGQLIGRFTKYPYRYSAVKATDLFIDYCGLDVNFQIYIRYLLRWLSALSCSKLSVDLYIAQCSLMLEVHYSFCTWTLFPWNTSQWFLPWLTQENYIFNAVIELPVKESSLCHLYVRVKVLFSLYNCKLVSYYFLCSIDPAQNILFLNGTSGFFALPQTARLGISHPCSSTLRATSISAVSLMAPGPFVVTWGGKKPRSISAPMWMRPILLKYLL